MYTPASKTLARAFNVSSPNESLGTTFNINEASFQQEGSTNSGWGGQVGIRKNFKSVSFYIRPWDSNSLMTQVRCLVKIGDYTGTVLADKTISVSVTALTPQKITVTFDSEIINANNDILWIDFKCNGKTGCFSRLNPGITPATRIYQGNSLTTSGLNVTAGNEKDIWFEFTGDGIAASVTPEFKNQLKTALGLPAFLQLKDAFTANVNLPSELFAVEGRELNIYLDNIIWSPLPLSMLEVDIVCSIGKQYDKGWRITPLSTDAGTYSLTVNVKIAGYVIGNVNEPVIVSPSSLT